VTLYRFILCFLVIRWRSHQHVFGGVFESYILKNTVFLIPCFQYRNILTFRVQYCFFFEYCGDDS
jgi:hypothetical protein